MKTIRGYILLGVGLLLTVSAGATWWYYRDALHFPERSFAETRDLLEPHIRLFLPAGEGPFPTAVLLHGCDGLGDSAEPRALEMAAQGYAAVLVDSLTPRNIDWRMNCDGRVLLGPQRAADVLVALDYARRQPGLDAGALFLVGYSHGAWTALEALHYGDGLPPGLTDGPEEPLAGLRGVVAWYPYCGLASTFGAGWEADIPVLMLLAEEDEITDPAPCAAVAAEQEVHGHTVKVNLYPGVSHGFDLNADWVVRYDPDTADRARRAQYRFLAKLAP